MLTDLLDDFLPYVICILPWPFVIWAWLQWRRQPPGVVTSTRNRLTTVSLGIGSASCLLLAIFPSLLLYLDLTRSELADSFYRWSVQLGFFAAVACALLALFAVGRLRIILVIAGFLLLCVWFLVGALY